MLFRLQSDENQGEFRGISDKIQAVQDRGMNTSYTEGGPGGSVGTLHTLRGSLGQSVGTLCALRNQHITTLTKC